MKKIIPLLLFLFVTKIVIAQTLVTVPDLSGTYYYHKTSNPLSVSMVYDSSLYGGKRLVADMVRFVPVTP